MYLDSSVIRALILLAEQGGIVNSVKITTSQVARYIGTSQQSASRLLIRMERWGLVERRIVGRTGMLKITNKGMEILSELYVALKRVIEKPVEITLEGRVFSGLGEGAYYLSLPNYRNQIKEKLGFDPYPGTLNIRLLSRDSIENKRLLMRIADLYIEGFKDGVRSYGGVKAIMGTFNDNDLCGILFIERTHYGEEVIEVIAPVYLRGRYELKDGEKVSVKVTLPGNRHLSTGSSTTVRDLYAK
ncbi:MAG: DUF120 domain-containing protein [Aigarchaeota archaeon]|nr:DUF120 domain-containing protein [Aigarchaeota archaeon]MDW8092446.1 DUF120 domain-containing protein [Nitrososphaerota archaeon]